MRTKRIFIAAFTIAAIVGCQKSENQISDDDRSTIVEFISNGISTRVSDDGSEWSVSDSIGITKSDNLDTGSITVKESETNVLYTATTLADSDIITFIADKESVELEYSNSGTMNFYGYYPYSATLTTTTYNIELSDEGYFPDFMWASAPDISKYQSVAFEFSHKMAKLELSIIKEDHIESLYGAEITIKGLSTSAEFEITTGDFVSYKYDDNTTPIATTKTNYIADSSSSSGYYLTDGDDVDKVVATAIILPETTTSEMVIFIENDGRSYELVLNLGLEFNSSTIYSYKIYVGDDATFSPATTISPWEDEVEGEYPYSIEQKSDRE